MKRNIKSKLRLILIFALSALMLFSLIAVSAFGAESSGSEIGRSFTSADELSMTNHLKAQPLTYKARINLPEGASLRGVIFGNYREADISCLNFEITAEGKPSLYVIDSSKVETRIVFDYDVRGKGFIDLAITHRNTDTGSDITCYVNGEAIGTVSSELSLNISLASSQRLYPFALGHDWYSSSYYFKGEIGDLAIYDKALSAEEISAVCSGGVDLSDESLLAYYDLTAEENRVGTKVLDSTDGDHDFERLFQDTRRDFEYAYSFAVVGDTQHLVYRDAHYGTDFTSPIYDWIVKNRDSKKIKFVMGLGDITDKNGKDNLDDGIDKTNVEWDIAVAQLAKLYEADIPYSLVSGNHDTVAQLDKFFSDDPNFKNADIGYYSGESLGNYYIRFTAGDAKYMVVALDYGANDNILKWAGEAIAANPEHKVIITTHAYMCADGTSLEADDSTSVPRPTNPNATEKDRNNGDDMWHELASRYENVILVLSGHISASDIVHRSDYGDNGNTVHQMLINFQTMDTKYSRETGMVAMYYFSEDGRVVNVEYVSTYKSLKRQSTDESAPDVVYRPSVNSFSIEYPEELGVGEETEYGTISPAYLDKELYPVVVFKKDKTFVGGFYELNHAMQSLVSVYNDKSESYVMYFRSDSVNTTDVVNFASFDGELVIDLNGTTVRNTPNYMINCTFSDQSSATPKITIKNGKFIKDKNTLGLIKIDYTASLTADAYCDITFENVTFVSLVNYNNNTSVAFVTYEGGYDSATATVRVNAKFTDCTFDHAGSVSGAVMIPMKHYYKNNLKDRVIFDVKINGGTVIANTAADFTSRLALSNNNDNGRADSVTYGRGTDGKYITLVLPEGTSAPTASYSGASGEKCVFNAVETEDGTSTYTLINADALMTKYGAIGAAYENAELYPVVMFKKSSDTYTFVGAYQTFNAATADMANVSGWYKAATKLVILLRTDATSSALCKLDSALGTYIVDLDGHTLTQTSNALFTVNRSIAGADPASVVKRFTFRFMNGTVNNISDSAMFTINYGAGTVVNAESYAVDFFFDNVVFKTTNKVRSLFANWETDASNVPADSVMRINVGVVFNDCTFDLTDAPSGFVMIDMADDAKVAANDRTVYTVTVNGGTIISDRAFGKADLVSMNANANGRDDLITFGKNSSAEYTKLILPSAVASPSVSDIYLSVSGAECVFAKAFDEGENTVYRIRPLATVGIDFTPKMSISLDRSLIMNVYVPKALLVKFTLDGVEYTDLGALEAVTLDGKEYYLIKLALPASEAAREVKLVATVSLGEKSASATFTFSIPKYSEKIIKSGNDTEKQLVRDVLSYVRAAYIYFGSADAEAIANLDAILGEGYDRNNAPELSGSAEAPSTGLSSVTFVLGATPAIRFYITESAESYAFYVGGSKLKTVVSSDANGTYVEMDVYAYAMCETITYCLDGKEAGTYHINSYYTFVTTDEAYKDNAELINLVARFAKYCESARDYRDSVVAG